MESQKETSLAAGDRRESSPPRPSMVTVALVEASSGTRAEARTIGDVASVAEGQWNGSTGFNSALAPRSSRFGSDNQEDVGDAGGAAGDDAAGRGDCSAATAGVALLRPTSAVERAPDGSDD